ncbi:MAG: ABC transporter permease [Clostridia bacterium]|nr:ABC transporter permease [Clostridia bacterium]
MSLRKNRESASKTPREPLFHIVKRDSIVWYKAWAVRLIAVLAALVVCGVLITLLSHKNPLEVYKAMVDGNFGTERRIWMLFQELAILLCVSLAVTPAFKMQFWNIGAEGQVLMGGLSTAAVMLHLGGKVPYPVLIIIMVLASMLTGAIWGLIPALFKAKWNTNETLFTLMMNYIATQVVLFCICKWVRDGSGILRPMKDFGLPVIGPSAYFLNILVVALLTVLMYVYLRYSKQGYEISVVGQSRNTARYVGISVPKVIIRTMFISGLICGLAGLLLVGGTNYTVSTETAGGRGFTAIMVSWLGKFNPLYMILTAGLVAFLKRGSINIVTQFRLNDAISDIITGIILFFIIGCEFFLNYKIMFRHRNKEVK